MSPRRELYTKTRALIIAYHTAGINNRQSFLNKRHSGRRRATTSADDHRIVITGKMNRRKPAQEITAELNVGC